jgi:hypothetical protein
MMNIKSIRHRILLHGKEIVDLNHNRKVKELICQEEYLESEHICELEKTKLLDKYLPELDDIQKWYDRHYPLYYKEEHRRHQVYFNNHDYSNRLQCISLFQVLDDTLIIYQRSSDTSKMIDDFRFFVEIKKRFFTTITNIHIFYGSLHTKIDTND